MTKPTTEWHKQFTADLFNKGRDSAISWGPSDYDRHSIFKNVADYVAQHEDPPVDPDLLKAREIAAQYWENHGYSDYAPKIRSGESDHAVSVAVALRVIKETKGERA